MTYFFVGGGQRSGTNLLQSILCSDATTNDMIREAWQLRLTVANYSLGKRAFATVNVDYFDDVEDFRAYSEDCVKAILDRLQRRFPDAANLVLKEPHLTLLFPQLHELVPGARFLAFSTEEDPAFSYLGRARGSRVRGRLHL